MKPIALVIDDTPANLKLAQYLLAHADFDVRPARCADEAWASVDLAIPDVVLMDMQMPGTDGFALAAQFKQDPRLSEIPIVAMTACAMTGDEDRARQAGCDAYISKPLEPLTFAREVRKYVRAAPTPL